MLTAFLRAFRTPDLRKKLLFTVFIIAVFRMGSSLPTPGVSQKAINACLATTGNTSIFQCGCLWITTCSSWPSRSSG